LTLHDSQSVRVGLLSAIAAFLMWGISPIYYRAVGAAPALEILAHRAVWSFLFTLVLVIIGKQWQPFLNALFSRRQVFILLISSLLVAGNWLGFIWAVNNGKALEASMGYYIMPVVMVLLGRFFLNEHLNSRQIFSFALVCIGVLNLLVALGELPWLALFLACSFGLYSLVRKMTPVSALVGLTIECLLLTPASLIYLVYLQQNDQLAFGTLGLSFDMLLVAAALMTALPLIFYTMASKRLKLGTVGLIQYMNPTCQFLLAVFAFGEPFTQTHLITFVFIWSGLALFSLDSHRRLRLAKSAGVKAS